MKVFALICGLGLIQIMINEGAAFIKPPAPHLFFLKPKEEDWGEKWVCSKCGHKNSGWTSICGKCGRSR